MSAWLITPPSSGTLAFSLRLAPSLPAADSPAFHTGSSASPWLIPNSLGPPQPPFLLTASSDTLASSLRLMPSPPATNALSLRSGSSAPSPTTPPSCGPIFSNCPPRLDFYYGLSTTIGSAWLLTAHDDVPAAALLLHTTSTNQQERRTLIHGAYLMVPKTSKGVQREKSRARPRRTVCFHGSVRQRDGPKKRRGACPTIEW